jgi:hypothetical protein
MRTNKAVLITILLLLTKPFCYPVISTGYEVIEETAPVKLKSISVGNKYDIWGIGLDSCAYKLQSLRPGDLNTRITLFKQSDKKFTKVSVGVDGSVYGIDLNKDFWSWNNHTKTWEKRPGKHLVDISIRNINHGWGATSNGRTYIWRNGTWKSTREEKLIPIRQLSIGDDGTLLGISGPFPAVWAKILLVWAWSTLANPFLSYQHKPHKTLSQVAVGHRKNIWGLDGTTVYKLVNKRWIKKPGHLLYIATSGINGPTLGIKSDYSVVRWDKDNDEWKPLTTKKQIVRLVDE